MGEGRTEGMVSRGQNDIGFYSFLAGVVAGYTWPLLGSALAQIVICPDDCIKGLSPSDPGYITPPGSLGIGDFLKESNLERKLLWLMRHLSAGSGRFSESSRPSEELCRTIPHLLVETLFPWK